MAWKTLNRVITDFGGLRCVEAYSEWCPAALKQWQYLETTMFYHHFKYELLNMLKVKHSTYLQDVRIVDLHFLKSE